MSKAICPICKCIIIIDLEEYRNRYPDEKEIQCPYCLNLVRLK
jgi:hypothetical protein